MAGERLQDASLRVAGIPGDRVLYVIDGRGEILSARTKPNLLKHHATLDDDGDMLVDGGPRHSPEVTASVRAPLPSAPPGRASAVTRPTGHCPPS